MSRKKHIDWFTIVTADTLGGGAEYQQINIFQYLQKNNHFCYAIILTKKSMGCWEFLEKNGKITYLPFSRKYIKLAYVVLIPFLCYVFLTKKISYSFTSQTLINGLVGFYKKLGFLKKTKVIVRESNSIFELLSGRKLKRYAFAYKIGYSKVDLVVCQTTYMKDQLVNALNWLEKKVRICVLDNPINLDVIHELSKGTIDGLATKNYMVAAGSLYPKKGFDILIETYAKIHNQFPDLELYILGEGPERENLTNQIKRLNLENNIVLKGFATNVYPYFKHAKLCVMSSRIEGFPNVLLQMMSQNHKVVTTLSAGGIEDIEGIFTAQTENIVSLKEAIITALNTDTSNNRQLFDNYLNKRSIKSYVNQLYKNL